MMKKGLVLVVLFSFIFSFNGYAKDVWQMANSPKYGEKAGGMLGRGLLNVVSCPVDIPVQMVAGAKKNKPEFIGAVGGIATGAVCTILRAGSGIIDVVTFWIPGFHGLPVSKTYDNCLAADVPAAAADGYVPPTSVYTPTQASSGSEGRMKYVKK